MKDMQLVIQRGTPQDADAVAHVYLASYNVKTLKDAKDAYRRELKEDHHFFVAFDSKQAIGFISWYMHGMPHHGLAELDRVAVVPEHRGKGVGKALFDCMLANAEKFYKRRGEKLRKIFLMTHDDNLRAQSFYKKMGLAKEAVLKSHYYSNRDEAVYSLFVKQ